MIRIANDDIHQLTRTPAAIQAIVKAQSQRLYAKYDLSDRGGPCFSRKNANGPIGIASAAMLLLVRDDSARSVTSSTES